MRTAIFLGILGLVFSTSIACGQQLIADFCFCDPANVLNNAAGDDGIAASVGTQSNGEGIYNNNTEESLNVDIPATIFQDAESITLEFDFFNQKNVSFLINAGGAEDAANEVPNGNPFRIGNKALDNDNNGNVGLLVVYYTTADPATPITSGFIPGSEVGIGERATVVFIYDKETGTARLFKNNELLWETPPGQRTPGENFYLETKVTDAGQGYLTVGFNMNRGARNTPSLYYFRAYDRACPTVPPPAVQAPPAPLCGEGTVTLEAISDQEEGNYRWYDATGGTALAGAVNSTFTTTLAQTTTYYVSVLEGPCESERVPVEVRVIALPPAPAAADQDRCGPGSVTFRAEEADSYAYHWYAADGTTLLARTEPGNELNDIVSDQGQSVYTTEALSETTDFYVAAVTEEGCESEFARVTARVLTPPPPPQISQVILCQPDTVTLRVDNPNEASTYRWYDAPTAGTLLQEDSAGALHTEVLSDIILHVSAWNGSCESERVAVSATIYPANQLEAGRDERILPDGEVQLQATEGYVRYVWHPSEGLSDPQVANPVANPTQTTIYWLTATTAAGCKETDQLTVEVVDYPIPNAFTPNNDGLNDRWELSFLERYPMCKVVIYNRWGEAVYHSEGYRKPWDGRPPGQSTATLGTYTYIIDLNNGKPPVQGRLLLLK